MQTHQFSKRKKLIIPLFKNRYIIQDGYDVKFDQLFKKKLKKNNFMTPFLWMQFNCLKAAELLQEDNLPFTTKSPEVSSTHLMDL